ncbi:T9SS sorting signal type C domain-containing protein [Flavobacterium sp. N502536]|uniref:T9SS sorting signal type C domain-containing protein n=1 Tax=Flavobacterium sp. N502536 TaxID=2986837 RepID=UPI0022229886|nr:T9SS sorting signal type C domain-containing protein [Flavobacterium sp. N502536]
MKKTLLSNVPFFNAKNLSSPTRLKVAILTSLMVFFFNSAYAQCSAPATPGTITGSATICQSSTQTYSISNVTGATSYIWTSSNGNLQITSSQGTNSITVTSPDYNLTSNLTVRAKNNCGESSSSSLSVSVVGNSRGGVINRGGLNQICINTDTGTMRLEGNPVGSVEKWEKRLNNSSTWTDIANTTKTYSEVPSSAGTWEYRAYVSNYGCSPQYSSTYTIIVKPEVVITPAPVTEAMQFSTSATLTYTGNNSDQYYLKFDPAAVAAGISSNTQKGNTSQPNGSITIQFPYCLAVGTYNAVLYVDTDSPKCTSKNYNVSLVIKPNLSVSGTLSSDQTICNNKTPNDLVLNGGSVDSVIKWQNSTDAEFTNPYDIPSSAKLKTLPGAKIGPLSQSTYFRVISQANGCSKTTSNVVLITVDSGAAATFTSSPSSTTCANTTTTYTTQPGKTNYRWYVPGTINTDYQIQTGGIGTSDHSVTLKWLTKGDKTVTVNYSNGCSTAADASNTTSVTITTAPTVGTIKQPNCTTPTGSVVLGNIPHSGKLMESRGTEYTYTTAGTTYEITGLAPGTYKFAIDDNCTKVYSADVVILPGNVWNGNKWSGGTPSFNDLIHFTGNYTAEADLNGCSCTIDNGATVTIKSGVTLTVMNSIDVDSGLLVFENNSSLIQKTNAVNTGNINYIRTSPPIFQKDYLYWSTPVTPQKLVDVSPLTTASKYYGNDGTQWVQTNRESNMVVGKGYIIRGPSNYTNTNKQEFTATFKGVPNNGDLEGELLAAAKSYLIGNPYPSALDADLLLKDNPMLNGTLYFWTHNTPAKPVATNQYSSDDYASYNLSGGVSAKSDKQHSNDPAKDKGVKPTGKIAAGQSFFVTTNAGGKVKFNNAMRVGGANNGQFFRPGNTSKETAIEKHRVWLNMTNATGAFKQLLVSYIEGATNDYESKYDGLTFDGNQYLDFYSVDAKNKYVIQGRALPFTDSDLVPLGYRTTVAGDFTVAIDEVDGNMSTQAIYIEDKATGVVHNLSQSNYTFKTEAGTFAERLTLRYKAAKTLGTGDFENTENGILVSSKNKSIQLLSSKENIKEVSVFDITGKQLYNKTKINSTELHIQNLSSGNQVLLVKVTLANDFTTTRKVLL